MDEHRQGVATNGARAESTSEQGWGKDGGPITPIKAALEAWTTKHAMISFAHPEQIAVAAEVSQSFCVDNGAFSAWKAGTGGIDVEAYAAWVNERKHHPGFDWCVIPDVVDGDEKTNQAMVTAWPLPASMSVPVWHLHESLGYLGWLVRRWPRVALGSSGQWDTPGTVEWWERMEEAMEIACDGDGRPRCKLHGLRMLDPTIFSHLPLSSADSCTVARNIGIDAKWQGAYVGPLGKDTRAMILARRFEAHASATRWESRQQNKAFSLLG